MIRRLACVSLVFLGTAAQAETRYNAEGCLQLSAHLGSQGLWAEVRDPSGAAFCPEAIVPVVQDVASEPSVVSSGALTPSLAQPMTAVSAPPSLPLTAAEEAHPVVAPAPVAPAPVPAPVAPAPVASEAKYFVQIGAFGRASNADAARRRIEDAGFDVRVGDIKRAGNTLQLVQAGPFVSEAAAREALARLKQLGFTDAALR